MKVPVNSQPLEIDSLLVSLIREIVIDHNDLKTILKTYQVSDERWRQINSSPRFAKLLEEELIAWNSAVNTEERTKLKAAAMIEVWLPEAHRLLHDPKETITGKAKLADLIAKIGGHGIRTQGEAGPGERFSVVINLGADANLTFDKVTIPHKVIEGEPVDVL